MTLDKIVIAPTAIVPPYFFRETLKQIVKTLSVNCIINGDKPKKMQGRYEARQTLKYFGRILSTVFFPVKKATTHIALNIWETTVAIAAPLTPMEKP